jgi:hypothetical protein
MDVMEQSASNMELDRLTILHAGDVKAWGYQAQSSYESAAAQAARGQEFYGLVGPILSGGSGAVRAGYGTGLF